MTTPTTQQTLLEAEFDPAHLDTVPVGGKRLTYVPVGEVIARLDAVLGAAGWHWQTDAMWREMGGSDDDDVWCLSRGTLTCTIDGVTASKSGVGGVPVSWLKDRKGERVVDLGNEYKGADSDALKKAAQRFGIGLYLARTADARAVEMEQHRVTPDDMARENGWGSADEARDKLHDLSESVKYYNLVDPFKEWMEANTVVWSVMTAAQHSAAVKWVNAATAEDAPEPAPADDTPPDPPAAATPTQERSGVTMDDVPTGSADQVYAWCRAGDLGERATIALELEHMTKKRKTVIKTLGSLITEAAQGPMPINDPPEAPTAAADPTPSDAGTVETFRSMIAACTTDQARAYAAWRRSKTYPANPAEMTAEQVLEGMDALFDMGVAPPG